jgi:hypothetical protein
MKHGFAKIYVMHCFSQFLNAFRTSKEYLQ